jgi:hypothetical protein
MPESDEDIIWIPRHTDALHDQTITRRCTEAADRLYPDRKDPRWQAAFDGARVVLGVS